MELLERHGLISHAGDLHGSQGGLPSKASDHCLIGLGSFFVLCMFYYLVGVSFFVCFMDYCKFVYYWLYVIVPLLLKYMTIIVISSV